MSTRPRKDLYLDAAMDDTPQSIGNARRGFVDPGRIANNRVRKHWAPTESEEPPDEDGIDFADQILHNVPLKGGCLNKRIPDLILLNGLSESNTTRLLFSLYQHDKIDVERPFAQQLRCSTRDRDDRAFIVCRASSV